MLALLVMTIGTGCSTVGWLVRFWLKGAREGGGESALPACPCGSYTPAYPVERYDTVTTSYFIEQYRGLSNEHGTWQFAITTHTR